MLKNISPIEITNRGAQGVMEATSYDYEQKGKRHAIKIIEKLIIL